MTFNLDGYTPVDERILDFYRQYPAGVITTTPAKTIIIGDRTFVSVIARVYLDRHMEDAPVTEAEAWEPFPGTTPYTRDSEMMNCATSAIGRALGQLGIGIQGGMASANEVHVARERQPGSSNAGKTNPLASEKQIGFIMTLAVKAGTTWRDIVEDGSATKICGHTIEHTTKLSSQDADKLIKALKDYQSRPRTPVVEDDPWADSPWPDVNA